MGERGWRLLLWVEGGREGEGGCPWVLGGVGGIMITEEYVLRFMMARVRMSDMCDSSSGGGASCTKACGSSSGPGERVTEHICAFREIRGSTKVKQYLLTMISSN